MSLTTEISSFRKHIKTDGYPMSIGEWLNMYEDREIDIHPEFQRFFRWSEEQKTALIESILLGIPIPPIFVSQRADGVWDVVDGLQRLSTIYQFFGVLRDEEDRPMKALVLRGTKYLPSLAGVSLEGRTASSSLPTEARLLLKRSKISASIILRESDESAKYDLFQRLNTGGSQLSPQEVRNCVMVMLNRDFYAWVLELSLHPSFKTCIALSDRPLEEAYDLELVLRFIVFSRISLADLNQLGDVGVFLTERMRRLAVDPKFSLNSIASVFKRTFDILERSVGEDAFKRFNRPKGRHEGGFLLSQFEVVALGLGFNISAPASDAKIAKSIQAIWQNSNYTDWAGSGITATRRLPHLIPLGRKLFAK